MNYRKYTWEQLVEFLDKAGGESVIDGVRAGRLKISVSCVGNRNTNSRLQPIYGLDQILSEVGCGVGRFRTQLITSLSTGESWQG